MKARFIAMVLVTCFPILAGADYALAPPAAYRDVVVWPVVGSVVPAHEYAFIRFIDYITLDEGMAEGSVVISEFGALEEDQEEEGESRDDEFPLEVPSTDLAPLPEDLSADWMYENQVQMTEQGEINQGQLVQQLQQGYGSGALVGTLHIQNNSDRPLFVMAGEVITGGKQNRVVEKDVLVPAKSGFLPLDVFCVEQGRWRGADEETDPELFRSGEKLVTQHSLRKVVMSAGEQTAVWSKISEINAAQDSENETGDYTENLQGREAEERLEEYLEALLEGMPRERAVGVIVAVGGEIQGGDIILHKELFLSLRRKLLRFYLLDPVLRFETGEGFRYGEEELDRLGSEAQELLRRVLAAEGDPVQGEPARDDSARSDPVEDTGTGRNMTFQLDELRGTYFELGSAEKPFRLHQTFFHKPEES
jgi:hypothetical protein